MKKVLRIRKQLRSYLKMLRLPIISSNGQILPVLKSIISGFFMNSCQLQNSGKYRIIRGSTKDLYIHNSSVLYGESIPWVIFTSTLFTDNPYIHYCTAINPKLLLEVVPSYFNLRRAV